MGIYEQCNQSDKYYYLDNFTKEDIISFINNLPWDYVPKEYNTDTSAEHSIMNDDIVRTIEKSIESRNKDA